MVSRVRPAKNITTSLTQRLNHKSINDLNDAVTWREILLPRQLCIISMRKLLISIAAISSFLSADVFYVTARRSSLHTSSSSSSSLPSIHHHSSRGRLLTRLHHRHDLTNDAAATYVANIARGGGCGGVKLEVRDQQSLDDIKTSSSSLTSAATEEAIIKKKDDATKPIIIRGGSNNDEDSDSSITTLLGLSINPRALATLSMATCMSLHYLAYSLARPATMTLFTSARLGFGNNVSAYPFAMTFISPVSFILLLFYGNVLENLGPLMALRRTTLGCASVLGLSSLLLSKLDKLIDISDATTTSSSSSNNIAILTRYLVGALFVFRESYVQLITSQHWSFISSVLTPNQSSTWFAPISGLTSVTSALAAMCVGKLSSMWGLQGVLGVAACVLGGSVVFGQAAYRIADKVSSFMCIIVPGLFGYRLGLGLCRMFDDSLVNTHNYSELVHSSFSPMMPSKHGFNPADEHKKKHSNSNNNKNGKSSSGNDHEASLVTKARDVFSRVPTLWALFCEILACQGLSTLLNVLCVTKVSEVISDDTERAGWMGKVRRYTYYSRHNYIS
jgi:hypothetical protein